MVIPALKTMNMNGFTTVTNDRHITNIAKVASLLTHTAGVVTIKAASEGPMVDVLACYESYTFAVIDASRCTLGAVGGTPVKFLAFLAAVLDSLASGTGATNVWGNRRETNEAFVLAVLLP